MKTKRRILVSLLRIAVLVLILPPALLLAFQRHLIYFPRDYDEQRHRAALELLTRLQFESKGKLQSAFLFNEPDNVPPQKIWWCFGGNGALAGEWMLSFHFIEAPGTTLVLFEYPGYGYNKGRANPKSIQRSIDDFQQLLSKRWGLSIDELNDRSAVLGHSLGASVGIDMAARHEIDEIVAISPFTTMKDMAKLSIGGLLSNLLLHRFDNERHLDEVVAQSPNASIRIFHGANDEMIPFAQGQSLANRHPDRIDFQSVEGAGHNDILSEIGGQLRQIVTAP